MNFFYVFYYVLPGILFLAAVLSMLLRNKFVVEHEERMRIAIRNLITGDIAILGQGTHYRPPWWVQDTIIDLNKEPMSTVDGGHRALTSGGIEVIVEARWDELAGRPFHPKTGQPTHADGHSPIDKEKVLWAITRTEFATRKEYVDGIVSSVIDTVIREFTADELLQVEESEVNLQVPKQDAEDYELKSTPVKNGRELLARLSEYIQREVNFRLREVGYNVAEFRVTDLRPRDPQLQEAQDRRQRLRTLRRATEELDGRNLSDREKFAIGTDQQGATANAQAKVVLAEAIAPAAQIIADAIGNFGRGD